MAALGPDQPLPRGVFYNCMILKLKYNSVHKQFLGTITANEEKYEILHDNVPVAILWGVAGADIYESTGAITTRGPMTELHFEGGVCLATV